MADDLAVHITDLSFTYPNGTVALEGVNLDIPARSRTALIGPNGSGKSTLMLHLNGLLHGDGTVEIFGENLATCDQDMVRRWIGLVFQNPDDQLFMPTVFDEVAYAAVNAGYSDEEVAARVATALETVEMRGLEERHPAHLSVGQKKRITIASVLVTDSRMLVLDEPAAGLDPAGRRELMALLETLDTTIILATHDLDLARFLCPNAAVMQAGTVAWTGRTAEIVDDPVRLREFGL